MKGCNNIEKEKMKLNKKHSFINKLERKLKMKYNYTEKMASEYANEISKSVVIRSYDNGNSKDERRESRPAEAQMVENAIAAALIAIKNGYDENSAKATAEFFVIHNSGETHINSYDSVYIPINNFLKINN